VATLTLLICLFLHFHLSEMSKKIKSTPFSCFFPKQKRTWAFLVHFSHLIGSLKFVFMMLVPVLREGVPAQTRIDHVKLTRRVTFSPNVRASPPVLSMSLWIIKLNV
jgi:hypothetical protein